MTDLSKNIEALREKKAVIEMGGGEAAIEKQVAMGKLTARERILALLDKNSFHEYDMFVKHDGRDFGMEKKVLPGDGVVTGTGTIFGAPVCIYAQDFTVAGGSLGLQKGKHVFSLILAKYMKSFLIYKGHVTVGVTRDIIDKLNITDRSPFHILPAEHEKAVWVKTDHVCVVEYMPNTKNSLRQPVFKGFRLDVLPEEVTVEQ